MWRIKMSKFSTFDELKSKRKEMVKSMKENDAFDGIKNLLTELYPDKAHFIFELLQNAEDMNATEVNFSLYNDRLIFTHNGNKRAFTLADVEAITNISKGTKKDDPTTIGQFGVGFKAVYAYTNTPEIYSEEYSFKIVDMLIPEDEGVTHQEVNRQTKFVFPFNNADKPEEKAVEEITEGLCCLDETAILFLTHINTINYTLPDGKTGYIKVDDSVSSVKFIKGILVKKVDDNEVISYWGKFNGQCPIVVNGKVKDNTVSIAYRMKKDDAGKFSVDSNLIGKVCIFFPTDQKSDLLFHINAPFASTVARDNIRYCDENDKLIEALANLCVESLYYFRGVKMLDYSVYEALPTLRDFNNNPKSRYKIFAEKIKTEFEAEKLFITEQGDYQKFSDVMWASTDIKTILPSLELGHYYQKNWLPRFTATSRTEFFIDQFKIKEFTIEDFIDSLEKDNTFFDQLFAEQKDIEYFKTLYYLFSQSKDREINKLYSFFSATRRPTRNEILHNVVFLMCEDGKLRSIKDTLFLKTTYQPKYYIKNPIYLNITFKSTVQDKDIKRFLISLGVKEMCEREDLIADVAGENIPVDDLILKVMEIIEGYKNATININEFIDTPIFIASNDDKKLHRVKAKECCWNTASAFFFRNTHFTLSQEHYKVISDDLPILEEIFIKLGGKKAPIFENILLRNDHPQFISLKTLGVEREHTRKRIDYGIAEFYNMEDLNLIRERKLKESSLLLWQQVLKEDDECKLQAIFRANNSVESQYLESSLVYYLKRIAWIPTKSGIYKCPYELTEDDLFEEFKYESPSLLLEAISKKPNDIVEQLKSKGVEDENTLFFAGCNADEQQLAREYIEKLRIQKQKAGKSLTELSESSDREQLLEEDDDDDYGVSHKSKNLDKRRIKLEKEFDDREQETICMNKVTLKVLGKPNSDEKNFVRNEYGSRCQICNAEGILTAKGKRYFEAINIFNTGKLDDSLQIKLDLGWNTLSLCPNCAAKFKYSQLTISNLIEQVQNIDINSVQSDFFDISIKLENKPTTIHFTPKHLLALQVAIKKIKEIETDGTF